MKDKGVCIRCHRERYVDRFRTLTCVHGITYKCAARTSCKVARKKHMKELNAQA